MQSAYVEKNKQLSKSTNHKLQLIILSLVSYIIFITLYANTLNEDFATLASNINFIGTSAGLTVFSILLLKRYDVKSKEGRRVLLFVFFAVFTFLGETTWIYIEQVMGLEPFPSIADFFWLFGNALFVLFAFLKLNSLKMFFNKKAKFAVFLIAISYSIIPFYISINEDSTAFETAIVNLYTILNGIIIALLVTTIMVRADNKIRFFILALIGIMAINTSDTLYATISSEYYTGNLIDLGWPIGYIFLAFSTRYYKESILQKNSESISELILQSNRLKTILNIIVPFVTASVILLAGVLYYCILVNEGHFIAESYLIVFTFMAFAAIVYYLSKNLTRFVSLRTNDIERQKQLLQHDLEEKTKLLLKQEKLAAIGQLAARLGHDLRNPLYVIQGSSQLLRKKIYVKDQKTQKYFDKINDAVLRISYQIENVLDFVRVKPLNISQCSLKQIICSLPDKMIMPENIEVVLPQNDVLVSCDQKRLEVVFINLITNAIQAIGNNNGKIIITLKEKHNAVYISVQDSGPGISAEIRDKLFEPLVTTKQTGTGLGLVSCKTIVEQHGGTITVSNNPTVFTVTLPKERKQ